MMKKEYKNMKVYEQSGYHYKRTPAIMLKGQWLRDLGFEENPPIVMHCEGGKLTITRADEVEGSITEITAEPVMCVAEPASDYGKEPAYV